MIWLKCHEQQPINNKTNKKNFSYKLYNKNKYKC